MSARAPSPRCPDCAGKRWAPKALAVVTFFKSKLKPNAPPRPESITGRICDHAFHQEKPSANQSS